MTPGAPRATPGRSHAARRRAVEILYSADLRSQDATEIADTVADLPPLARTLVRGVVTHGAAIDDAIARHARGWSLRRMPVVDRNVLRLATYELLHAPDAPAAAVVIDEAVELCKELSTERSPSYVNGVLEAIRREEQMAAPEDASG